MNPSVIMTVKGLLTIALFIMAAKTLYYGIILSLNQRGVAQTNERLKRFAAIFPGSVELLNRKREQEEINRQNKLYWGEFALSSFEALTIFLILYLLK